MGGGSLETLIARIREATRVSELTVIVRQVAQTCGFDYVLFALQLQPNPIKPVHFIINGFPSGWKQLYDERNFITCDPVIAHCLGSLRVAWWADLQVTSPQQQAFLQLAAEHGLVDGVTWPVAGRHQERGLFSLANSRPLNFSREQRARLAGDIYYLLMELYEASVRIALPSQDRHPPAHAQRLFPKRNPHLTDRQKQIVLLLAAGYTASRVAERIGITERTVRFHFDEACARLGVSGLEQLLAKSQSTGLMNLHETGIRSGLAQPEIHNLSA